MHGSPSEDLGERASKDRVSRAAHGGAPAVPDAEGRALEAPSQQDSHCGAPTMSPRLKVATGDAPQSTHCLQSGWSSRGRETSHRISLCW